MSKHAVDRSLCLVMCTFEAIARPPNKKEIMQEQLLCTSPRMLSQKGAQPGPTCAARWPNAGSERDTSCVASRHCVYVYRSRRWNRSAFSKHSDADRLSGVEAFHFGRSTLCNATTLSLSLYSQRCDFD
eukprot:6018716-Amphidinium_carterae.1